MGLSGGKKVKFWGNLVLLGDPARIPEGRAAGRESTGFHLTILLQICQRRAMAGEGSLAEGWFGESAVSWKELWGGKDRCDQSSGARAAVERQEDTASPYSCVVQVLHTCGPWVEVGAGTEGDKPKADKRCQHQRPFPGSAYQPRFRQSKAMTPFSSGVHLMPGEIKAASFTSSVRLRQSP